MKHGHITVPMIIAMKREKRRIVAVTSYDFMMTRLVDEAGVDMILVGDSLGMVKLGYDSTLPVTLADMVYHTRIVSRAKPKALLVADMPFLSYQASPADAVRSAGQLIKAGAQAVKLEGGEEIIPQIRAIRKSGIPVLGHLGMTPQSVHEFGGYRVQGRDAKARKKIHKDAILIQNEGVFAIVLECVPASVASVCTRRLQVPTIGIGAGKDCDGQILVLDDLLGLTPPPHPRFVKRFSDLRGTIHRAVLRYADEIRRRSFPGPEHSY